MSEVKSPEQNDGSELHEHYSFTAGKGQEPLRVDKFLMNFIENASRNKIQEAAKNGHIFVDGKAVKQNHKVKANQEVKILLEYPREDFELVPEDIPLEIVYEDDELLVVNKPAGMVVHPGHGNRSGTLVNALVYHFKNLPENSSRRPGLVHRIDKETSGLLVVAKTDEAMTKLADQFFHKTSKREYIAMVWGNMKDDKGKIQGHIGRNPKNRLQNLVFEGADADEFGKAAVTHYQVLERLGYITLISCRLETGRTHQIRVHLKHIGHTLFNDKRYGGDHILKGTVFTKYKQFVENAFKILPRQALHAKTLGFEHPKTGKWMQFDSEVPEDMQNTLEKWRKYAENRSLYE
jgi:23S rRNA pseudouridine1911/1915/1917 synthase